MLAVFLARLAMKQTFFPLIVIPVLALASFFVVLGADVPADPAEAARLNNLGVAYMNQQLFDKALKSFEAATAKDPNAQGCGA